MKVRTSIRSARALRALDRAGGQFLTKALRSGYTAAARLIRDKARETAAFTDRTGTARKSWKVTGAARRFNHAKVINTAFHSRFLEGAPLESEFLTKAARATGPEQVKAVRKAVLKHLLALRAGAR